MAPGRIQWPEQVAAGGHPAGRLQEHFRGHALIRKHLGTPTLSPFLAAQQLNRTDPASRVLALARYYPWLAGRLISRPLGVPDISIARGVRNAARGYPPYRLRS